MWGNRPILKWAAEKDGVFDMRLYCRNDCCGKEWRVVEAIAGMRFEGGSEG